MAGPKVQGELSMDGSKFFGVLGQANTAVSRFGNSVTSGIGGKLAAAFSVGAVGMAIRKTMDYADSIEEMSSRIGVGTDKLQEWTFAAKQSGADTEKLVTFIERLSTAAGDIKNLKGFQAMGINPAGMSPEELFQSVSGTTRGKGSTDIVRMMEGVGLSIKQIGPMVNVLSSDLDGAGKSARNLGAVIDQATLHRLASLNDQLSIVTQILMGQFAPALLMVGATMMRTFGAIQGAGGWLGARTANFQPADILKAMIPIYGPKMVGQKLAEGEKMGLSTAAANEFAAPILAIEEMLKKIMSWKASDLPKISIPAAEAKAPRRSGLPSASSLVEVGNFLGQSRKTLESLASQQVELLRQIALNTRPETTTSNTGFPT